MLFVLFQLGTNRFAIEAGLVDQVLPLLEIRPLPGAPEGIAGVFDWHGTPVPVVDLSRLVLGRGATAHLSTRLVVVRCLDESGLERRLGLIAERATETMRCEASDFVDVGVVGRHGQQMATVVRGAQGLVQRVEVATLLPPSVREALFKSAAASP